MNGDANDLQGQLVQDLLRLYRKYREAGLPGTMILGTIEELKSRLLVQAQLRQAAQVMRPETKSSD